MKTCPFCGNTHANQEFSPFCDVNCAIDMRRDYDKACRDLDERELEKQRNHLKYI